MLADHELEEEVESLEPSRRDGSAAAEEEARDDWSDADLANIDLVSC